MASHNASSFLLSLQVGWGALLHNPEKTATFCSAASHDGREKTSWGSYTDDKIDRPRPHAPNPKETTRKFNATRDRTFWWSELMSTLEVREGCKWYVPNNTEEWQLFVREETIRRQEVKMQNWSILFRGRWSAQETWVIHCSPVQCSKWFSTQLPDIKEE